MAVVVAGSKSSKMLNKQTRGAILRLSSEGHSIRSIALLLSVSPTTVRAVIRAGSDEVPTIQRSNKAEPYRGEIVELLSICDGNLIKVHEQLRKIAATFSYPALTRFCRRNGLWDAQSCPTHSANSAQEWLTEILYEKQPNEILKAEIPDSTQLTTLLYHLKNGRHRERAKAATILARKRGIPNSIIARIFHCSSSSIKRYYTIYSKAGLSVLFGRSTRRYINKIEGSKKKTKRIVELLHQKPQAFGVNRTSWTQHALIQAYKQCYDETISRCTVARLIKIAGYGWKKARRILTSPDPNYRDKVSLLLKTLQSIAADEMYFFLDEWGPVQVRKRGGKAYSDKDNIPKIPRHQVSKGTVALVGALSATTNQMTWAFVTSKDTRSMMDFLETLFNQHHTKSKLFVTWDAVSWHNSNALIEWLDEFNKTSRRESAGPIIELVPLPTSAQFLNVIEGVLSGMTRAVINNSDYQSGEDMKLAISKYFSERNEHFRENPQRAGKKMWEMDYFFGLDAFKTGDYREW